MRILIIEDEPRAAGQLLRLIKSAIQSFELAGIIDSVEEAVTWFKTDGKADLIFMDIQLADGLSFEIFQHAKVRQPIIFTTAFDEYAIKAFKVNSIDYLLKPIQSKELEFALKKFEENQSPAKQMESNLVHQLLQSMQNPRQREGILVREGNVFVRIKTDDLHYVYSEDSISFGITKDKRYIIDETIDQLYQSLDPHSFFKINRGQIVSKSAILQVSPYLNHRLKLKVVKDRDQEFIVSRNRSSDFKHWLNH